MPSDLPLSVILTDTHPRTHGPQEARRPAVRRPPLTTAAQARAPPGEAAAPRPSQMLTQLCPLHSSSSHVGPGPPPSSPPTGARPSVPMPVWLPTASPGHTLAPSVFLLQPHAPKFMLLEGGVPWKTDI